MVALEDAFQTRIDEGAFAEARDVSAAAHARRAGATGRAARPPSRSSFRRGTGAGRRAPSAASACRPGFCRSARVFAWITRRGPRASATRSTRPVIFAANHQSHMDTPVILAALPRAAALPGRAGDGQGVLQGALLSRAVRAQGAGSPTASTTTWRRSSSTRSRCRSAKPARGRRCATSARCSSDGFSVLIFPEGRRTRRRARSTGSGRASA